MAGILLLASCSTNHDILPEDNIQTPADVPVMVSHEVTVSLGGDATTRVVATPGKVNEGQGLLLKWSEYEQLGVYIQNGSSITRAGYISSVGPDEDTNARTFTGKVMKKPDGAKYIYMHPDLGSDVTTIDFTSQKGELGSTAHLPNYIPLVWREGQTIPENQGYVFHLTLTMNEDPGAISSITLHTMNQGTDGTTPDKIFPKTFKVENLGLDVNSTLLSAKTSSMSLSEDNDYTDAISLTPASGTSFAAKQEGSIYKVDAYIAASSVKNLDVFRTKYNVKIDAENGSFFVNEYLSFPGQQSATAESGLNMLENGKCYNLARTMSKDVAYTVISDQYKVNSLLGMWNTFGKPFDPFGLICNDNNVPSQLKTNILDKKAEFTAKTLIGMSSQGSPTFTWQMVTKQCKSAYKQDNVTYNNINITKPTEVFVTFISEYAWSQNLLAYYHFNTGDNSITSSNVKKTFIFPNVSKGGHVPYNLNGSENKPNINPNTSNANVGTSSQAPLQEYTTVQLLYYNTDGSVTKTFPANTTIGFMIMRDPQASNSGQEEGQVGVDGTINHDNYQPRQDNSLVNWSAWRLFTNTAWNSENSGWGNYSCCNFFCSANVGDGSAVIPGLALYGAKDDPFHNYDYSFSAMLYMVSTSDQSAMQTQNKCYFNLNATSTTDLVKDITNP